jgi:hypothetical protein
MQLLRQMRGNVPGPRAFVHPPFHIEPRYYLVSLGIIDTVLVYQTPSGRFRVRFAFRLVLGVQATFPTSFGLSIGNRGGIMEIMESMEAHPISVGVLHPSSAKYVQHAGDLPLHQCGSSRLNFHLVSRTSRAVFPPWGSAPAAVSQCDHDTWLKPASPCT